jgi:hypothetical protein
MQLWSSPLVLATLGLGFLAALRADSVGQLIAPLHTLGNSLQMLQLLLLLSAWTALADGLHVSQRALRWVFLVGALPVAACIALAFIYPGGSADYRHGFAWVMRWLAWPAPLAGALLLTRALIERHGREGLDTDQKLLALSLLLFVAGCAIGLIARGDSISLSAHLHGTYGALIVATLAWWHRLGREQQTFDQAAGFRPGLFAAGLGFLGLVLGLGIAGKLATSTAPQAMGASAWLLKLLQGTATLAGLMAVAALLFYAALALRTLLDPARQPRSGPRDVRPWALTATLVVVMLGGWLLQLLPRGDAKVASQEHAAQQIKSDIETRFQQGVVMLHAKQYDHALTAFHRVLQLAPKMPEAHVNIGFTLLGLQRYKEAADFFDSATMLRPNQTNAYYGLALALEASGDTAGAVEAMQAFSHLAKPDDPYKRKADAALWEWREALAKQRANAAAPAPR